VASSHRQEAAVAKDEKTKRNLAAENEAIIARLMKDKGLTRKEAVAMVEAFDGPMERK